MHIELDTDKGTIKLHGKVNLEELLVTLEALEVDESNWTILPDIQEVIVKEYIPYIIKPTYVQPSMPWITPSPWTTPNPPLGWPTVWCGTASSGYINGLAVNSCNTNYADK